MLLVVEDSPEHFRCTDEGKAFTVQVLLRALPVKLGQRRLVLKEVDLRRRAAM